MKHALTGGVLAALVLTLLACADSDAEPPMPVDQAQALIERGDNLASIPKATWRELLPEERYEILWEKGTEPKFSGALLNEKRSGTYVTAGCEIPVFRSEHKYDSGTGWPSFYQVLDADNIELKDDYSWGMHRTEVVSACGEHLGHVFDDGPAPTGKRYCINSLALKFIPDDPEASTAPSASP